MPRMASFRLRLLSLRASFRLSPTSRRASFRCQLPFRRTLSRLRLLSLPPLFCLCLPSLLPFHPQPGRSLRQRLPRKPHLFFHLRLQGLRHQPDPVCALCLSQAPQYFPQRRPAGSVFSGGELPEPAGAPAGPGPEGTGPRQRGPGSLSGQSSCLLYRFQYYWSPYCYLPHCSLPHYSLRHCFRYDLRCFFHGAPGSFFCERCLSGS